MTPKDVQALYDRLKTWEAVGNELGLNKGIVFRFAKLGLEPTRNDLRNKLGLPEIIVRKQAIVRDPKGRFAKQGEATSGYVNQE